MTFEVGECRGNLFLEKPIPSMGRKVIEHTSEGTPVIHNFADYYFKEGWLLRHVWYKKNRLQHIFILTLF